MRVEGEHGHGPGDGPGAGAERRMAWARRGVWAVLLAGVVAFLVEGADQPADPTLVPAGEQAQARAEEPASPPPGPSPAVGRFAAPSTTSTSPPPSTSSTSSAASAPPPAASAAPAPSTLHPAPAPSSQAAPSPPPSPSRRPLPGFDEVRFRITSPGGSFDGVALLADDQRSRGQGLMDQRDLRGYDGMIFRFERPSTGRFFMRNTIIPLSIAFFNAGGHFVSATDMEPCPDEVEECPRYAAAGPYLHAIEVPAGDLPRLGIGPGAVLSFSSG